jgi:hypothetical protein
MNIVEFEQAIDDEIGSQAVDEYAGSKVPDHEKEDDTQGDGYDSPR